MTPSNRASNFPLRLSSSTREDALACARREGISLNYFISLAISEKISRTRSELWRGDLQVQPPRTPQLSSFGHI